MTRRYRLSSSNQTRVRASGGIAAPTKKITAPMTSSQPTTPRSVTFESLATGYRRGFASTTRRWKRVISSR